MRRPTWTEYWSGTVLDGVRSRATCDRGKSGCVIVRDNDQISSGYVGAPPGMPHCDEVGHELEPRWHEQKSYDPSQGDVMVPHPTDSTIVLVRKEHCVRTIHAETNAICRAARRGVALNGATLYCSMFPCWDCAKAIVAAGIVEVIVVKNYHTSGRSKDLFDAMNVKWSLLDVRNEVYE